MIKKFVKWLIEEKLPYVDYVHEDFSAPQKLIREYLKCTEKINIVLLMRCYYYSMAKNDSGYDSFLYNTARSGWGTDRKLKNVLDKYVDGNITISTNHGKNELIIIYPRESNEYGDFTDSYQRFPLDIIMKYKSIRGFQKHFRKRDISKEEKRRKDALIEKQKQIEFKKKEYEKYLILKQKFDKDDK